MFVSFNHRLVSAEEAKIPALASIALYGAGVFTTIAVYNQKPFQWEKHWQRLCEAARKLSICLSQDFNEESVGNSLAEIIAANELKNGRARVTFFNESSSKIWTSDSSRSVSLLIVTGEFRAVGENLRLTLSPFRVNSKSPLAGIKSCNYLENLLALEEAKTRAFDETVRLNEDGFVASACMANIFWVKDGAIFTPALELGCLEGTTRAFVIEMAERLGLAVHAIAGFFDDLRRADEIFLTSANLGIAQVGSLNGETYGAELTVRLQAEFSAEIFDTKKL